MTATASTVLTRDPQGSLRLVGGQEYGHMGFGMALMIEALSQGLSGHGRRDAPSQWGGNVFLQVVDPELFAGREAFLQQMDFLSDRCHENRPIRADRPMRVPGDAAARGIADPTQWCVTCEPAAWTAIECCAHGLGVPLPSSR